MQQGTETNDYYEANLLPILPGFPKTPCHVIGEVAYTNPIKYQIRLESGAFCAVAAHRVEFLYSGDTQ